MKLTVFLLLLSVISVFASKSYSQTKVLNLDMKNSTVKEVLRNIEKQSEFDFIYSEKLIDVNREVSVNVKNKKINDVLDELFAGTDVSYKVKDRFVLLTTPEVTGNDLIIQQQSTVSGTVTDESGQPLPGVTVVVKGTTQGTVTNADGIYSLTNIPEDATLVFSFVGMRMQEVVVESQTNIDVRMVEDMVEIEEVVAIGYGFQEKKNLTGAVDQVSMEKIIASRPVSSTAQAIQGVLPGLQVTSGSGRPGEPSSIRIRGIMSITGGSPLILVDNVPMNIENLNPSDIETITVLKDASSSSIYGGRAAFGVILITTKKANVNEPIRFNYKTNVTVSQPINLPVKLTTEETIKAWQDWGNHTFYNSEDLTLWSNLLSEYKSDPSKYPEGETYVDGVLYRLAQEDLYKKFMSNGFEHMHNFSFSGGSEKSNYRVSFGYADEDGIMITNSDSYKKFNVNTYLNTELTKRLSSTTNILYNNSTRLTPNNYMMIFYQGLTLGRHINSGYHITSDGIKYPYNTPNNILENEPPDRDFNDDLRFFQKLEYNLTSGLNIVGEYTYNKSNFNSIVAQTENMYWDAVSEVPAPITFRMQVSRNESGYYRSNSTIDYHAFNFYTDYQKEFDDHKFIIVGGTNQELRKYSRFWADRALLLNFELPSLATASGTMTNGESLDEYAISGYFVRFNYSYKNKYLFETNARYDGSSKFPSNSRFGLFPSVSMGWVLTEEPFFKSIENSIDYLKIRGSYGNIGNQDISNYAFIPGMSAYNSDWIDPSAGIPFLTIAPPALVSSSFTWETVKTQNIGVDISLFDQRLGATFDYFNRKTLRMLGAAAELPAVIGASAPQRNVADLESKGWEFRVDWRINKNDFGYSIGLNLSDNRAFITKFDNEGGLLGQYYEGYEFGEIWGLVSDGFLAVEDFEPGSLDENLMNGKLREGVVGPYFAVINPNPGDMKYVDLDESGRIDYGNSTLSNPGDRKIIGNNNRRYQFGIIGNGYYKNFDFSFLIQGVGKRDVWLANQLIFPNTDKYFGNYRHQLDYWTPENIDAFYPRNYSSAGGNTQYSRLPQTKYLLNGAYLMLKNIEFGYNFEVFRKQSFNNKMRLFFSAENLFKLDDLPPGVDPELTDVAGGGIYPQLRKFSLGLNVSF